MIQCTTSQNCNRSWRNNQQPRHDNQQQLSSKDNICCQLCDGSGHTTRVCRKRSHNHLQARTNYAAHLQNQSDPWIVDSSATHHIALSTQSLTTMQDYHGSEEIIMGNGNTIQISHTYNVNFNASNHQFQLNMSFSFNYYK